MGGKSDAPPPPDYVGQAQTQSAGNLDAARAQTQANRINQVNPYGSIKYTQGDGFDEAGYNSALAAYRNQEAGLQANPAVREYMRATGSLLTQPNRNDYVLNPDKWSSEIELSSTGQALLDADSRARLGLADAGEYALNRVRYNQSHPFDMSGLQEMQTNVDGSTGMDAWQKYSDLLMSRMNPDLDRQQAALDTKLANQGLTQGSEGWQTGQSAFGKQRNDAGISAQLAGAQVQKQFFDQALQNAGLKNTSRQQQLNERKSLRDMDIDELIKLRSAAGVTNPTFSTPGQQGQTSGPDLMGASQASYNAQVGNVNANNAAAAQTNSAIGTTVAMAAAYFF